MNKRESVIESLAKVECSRFEDDCIENMLEMLWRIAKGTRYQSEVETAFDVLEGIRERKNQGSRY